LAQEVVPNDPYYRPERNQRHYQQWFLPKINANYAWSVSSGSDAIIVAVVDSGVDLHHPDLKGRLLRGVSIVHQDNYTPPADGMDDNGHGTHIAGLVGAMSNNGVGVCGTSWSSRILPVKVLNNKGEGTDADIISGIQWAADAGARIINMSLGGPSDDNTPPQALQDAVNYAYSKNCLVIAAAGNSGDNTKFYPADLNNVIAVASTDPEDHRASYSTFGPDIDLAAPGGVNPDTETGILSTYWDSNSVISDAMSGSEAGEYAIAVGTSMAAGIVSGAAAVIWAHDLTMTPDQVANLMLSTATLASTPNQELGHGRIDVLAALGATPADLPELAAYNYPNPFNPDRDVITRIVFMLNSPRNVKLKIYDTARDLVWERALSANETLAGKNAIDWDGRNGTGIRVANGAYFYRLSDDSGRTSKTKVIAVLR
jgi:subtilisin family serine protease